jgi:hypothetical protein
MQITPFNKIASFLVAIFLFSCGVAPFDYEAAYVKNGVTKIYETYYDYINGEKRLSIEKETCLRNNGKIDSIVTIIHYNDETSKTVRKFYYDSSNRVDSVVNYSNESNGIFITTEDFHYNYFRIQDSISVYTTFQNKRTLERMIIFSSNSEYDEVITRYNYPNRKVIGEEFYKRDREGKIKYSKTTYSTIDNNVSESYDYQYDNSGKLKSCKIKNTNGKNFIHYYDHFDNELRKALVITNLQGDTVSLHEYDYEFN